MITLISYHNALGTLQRHSHRIVGCWGGCTKWSVTEEAGDWTEQKRAPGCMVEVGLLGVRCVTRSVARVPRQRGGKGGEG